MEYHNFAIREFFQFKDNSSVSIKRVLSDFNDTIWKAESKKYLSFHSFCEGLDPLKESFLTSALSTFWMEL